MYVNIIYEIILVMFQLFSMYSFSLLNVLIPLFFRNSPLLWLLLCTKCPVIFVHGPAKQAINYVLVLVRRHREPGWTGARNHPFPIGYQLCFIYFISLDLQHARQQNGVINLKALRIYECKDIGISKGMFEFIQQTSFWLQFKEQAG